MGLRRGITSDGRESQLVYDRTSSQLLLLFLRTLTGHDLYHTPESLVSLPIMLSSRNFGLPSIEHLFRCGELENALSNPRPTCRQLVCCDQQTTGSNQQPPAIGTRSFPSLSYPQAVPSDLGVLITPFFCLFQEHTSHDLRR